MGNLGPHALLLVEDSFEDEALSLRAIDKSGIPCQVTVIRDGAEVLSTLFTPHCPLPELIILDFNLPKLSGLEILHKLRSHPKTRLVPVVILSSNEEGSDFLDCYKEGANSCVKKPHDYENYLDQVGQVVRYWLSVNESIPLNESLMTRGSNRQNREI